MAFWQDISRRLGLEGYMEDPAALRLSRFGVASLLFTVLCYFLRQPVADWLQRPLYLAQLSAQSSPSVGVGLQAMVFGLLIAVIYLSAVFLLETAPTSSGRHAHPILPWAIPAITATASLAVAYYALIPVIFAWLSTLDIDQIHTYITASSYRPLITALMILWTGQAVFIVAVPLLQRLGRDCRSLLARWRLTVEATACLVVLVFPVAPDPISKLLLAAPFVGSYELMIWLAGRQAKRMPARPRAKYPPEGDAQRLPMAIAVPHRAARAQPTDQLRAPRAKTIDLRPDHKRFDDI